MNKLKLMNKMNKMMNEEEMEEIVLDINSSFGQATSTSISASASASIASSSGEDERKEENNEGQQQGKGRGRTIKKVVGTVARLQVPVNGKEWLRNSLIHWNKGDRGAILCKQVIEMIG